MHPCCILFFFCSRVTLALLPGLKLPCSDLTSDLWLLSQLLQRHMQAGVQVTLCVHPTSPPALHTELACSNLGNFPPCHRGLGCSEVRSQRGTGESESGLKMLRDQRGKAGHGRVCVLGGGMGEHK